MRGRVDAAADLQGRPLGCHLVGLDDGRGEAYALESLEELGELARTAGLVVLGKSLQRRSRPDPAHFLGQGKLDEIAAELAVSGAAFCIFDEELTPSQIRNLERRFSGIEVLDRTQLILHIFAGRARSREGKAQVELAQLQYLLPRLSGKGRLLSRLGGGIGTRGPGETQLQIDRRRIRKRIGSLRRFLSDVRRQRMIQREGRRRAELPLVALVGYTNAGKSSLLNALTGAEASARNRPFETLDPMVRRASLPSGGDALFVDTVGFIRKLPHQLIAAFRATLEEVTEADVLIHVVDASHPRMEAQMEAAFEVLEELGVAGRPTVVALNKADRVADRSRLLTAVPPIWPAAVCSAKTGEGLDDLLEAVAEALPSQPVRCELWIPYRDGRALALAHQHGKVLAETHRPEGISLSVELTEPWRARLAAYVVGEDGAPAAASLGEDASGRLPQAVGVRSDVLASSDR